MSDVFPLEGEEAAALAAAVEVQLCHSEELKEELAEWPPVRDVTEIVRTLRIWLPDQTYPLSCWYTTYQAFFKHNELIIINVTNLA